MAGLSPSALSEGVRSQASRVAAIDTLKKEGGGGEGWARDGQPGLGHPPWEGGGGGSPQRTGLQKGWILEGSERPQAG